MRGSLAWFSFRPVQVTGAGCGAGVRGAWDMRESGGGHLPGVRGAGHAGERYRAELGAHG